MRSRDERPGRTDPSHALAGVADRTPARVRRIAPGARAADRTPDPRFQINPLINDYNGPACAYATGPFGPARGAGVREEVATTLARLRPASALEGLLRSMEDEAWQVRLRAARALGRLGDRRAGPPLCEALAHPAANGHGPRGIEQHAYRT